MIPPTNLIHPGPPHLTSYGKVRQHSASTDVHHVVFVIISSLLLLWCAKNIRFTFFYDRLTVKGEFEVKVGL